MKCGVDNFLRKNIAENPALSAFILHTHLHLPSPSRPLDCDVNRRKKPSYFHSETSYFQKKPSYFRLETSYFQKKPSYFHSETSYFHFNKSTCNGLESPVRDKILVKSLIIHQIGCPVRDKISTEYSVPNGTAYAHGIRFSTNIKSLTGFFTRRQSIICCLFFIP